MHGGLEGEVTRLEVQAELGWSQERRILERLGLREAAVVLDVGCGPGASLARLAEAAPAARIVGVEPDARLRELAALRVPEAELLDGDAEALPLAAATVDLALARYVFQHLPDPARAAAEIRRVLRPGGRLVAVEVDGELWGLVQPRLPGAQAAHEAAWRAQRDRGGDRMIGRRLWRILAEAGFVDLSLELFAYHSDELGLDAFAPLIDPAGLLPLVEQGAVAPLDYARAVHAYERFRADPAAFVLLVGIAVSGAAPAR